MATTQAIEPAATAQAKPAAAELPWADDDPRPPQAAPGLAAGPRRGHEPHRVHWSIVTLTLVTAASIVLGSHQANPSKPRELLPVMIVTEAR